MNLMRVCERIHGNNSYEEFINAGMNAQEIKAIKLSTHYVVENPPLCLNTNLFQLKISWKGDLKSRFLK